MLVVGVTGVMGAGKSTVCEVLKMLGISVYNCDVRAKELMQSRCTGQLVELLGGGVLSECGELNRGYIASKIFGDASLKSMVEVVVHSALREDMRQWINSCKAQSYVVVESAILFGSIIEEDMDMVVGVVADEGELIGRIQARDSLSEEQIRARLNSQLSQSEVQKRASEVIYTSNFTPIVPKVITLHKKLLTLSAE